MSQTYYILSKDAEGECCTAVAKGEAELKKAKDEIREDEDSRIYLICTRDEFAAWVSAAL